MSDSLMNEKMKKIRQAALDILKPVPRDLAHGLELHRDSLVVDLYGFGPESAVDTDVLAAAVNAGASKVELQDLHEDMMMTRLADDPGELEEYKLAWETAGVTCIFRNAGEEGQGPLRLIKRLSHFIYVTDRLRAFVSKAVEADDLVAARKAGRHCIVLACNGVPLTQDWISVEDELRYLKVFRHFGCRMMHLTYNRRNMLGEGCAEPANAGLSDLGRAVIAEMNRLGILVDVAHAGWRTSLEAAQASVRPMVASHTVCAALNRHVRGKPDEVLRAIADGGGLIGICAVPAFLGGTGTITALLDHIDYGVKQVGVDYIALGTDSFYRSSQADRRRTNLPQLPASRKGFEQFWPPNDPLFDAKWNQDPQRMSLDWLNWPMITVGLVQRGYADDNIRKIIGGNVLRVMGRV